MFHLLLPVPVTGASSLLYLGEFTPTGAPYFSIELARSFGLPVLIALPAALAVLFALGARWLAGARPSKEHPLEALRTELSLAAEADPLLAPSVEASAPEATAEQCRP